MENIVNAECLEDGIVFPANLDVTFDTMFSQEGLKGIIEFLLKNQDKFSRGIAHHSRLFESLSYEMTHSVRALPQAFKDLEEYDRKSNESLKVNLINHDDRIH